MSAGPMWDNLGALVDARAASDPERPALIVDDVDVSYATLAGYVQAASVRLRAAGVAPGARVLVADVGGVLAVAAVLAAARLGAAAALLDPNLAVPEMRHLAEAAGNVVVGVAGAAWRDRLAEALSGSGPSARQVLGSDDLLAAAVGATDPVLGDTAVVLFTSGTTGRPKAVAVGSAVLRDRLAPYAGAPDLQVRLLCVPIFHVGGLLGLLVSMSGGHTTVIQGRFDAGEWLRLVERHRVALTFLVPTMLRRILDHPDFSRTDLSSLTGLTYGAAPMPPSLIARAVEALPHVGFSNTFGQTETLGGITLLGPDDHRHPVHRTSVGTLLPGVDARILDPATQQEVADGEVGELVVASGQNVASGWLHTGDLVRRDADGYLYVAGRLSDVINRGGEKIGPVEVEDVLRAHPAVIDVAVVGIADDELGQRVGAVLVTSSPVTNDEIRAWCADRLARHKLPERLAFADAVPYSQLGKVDRKAVARLVVGEDV